MTINPHTLVTKSFIGKELRQGHQDGHPPCVAAADQYLQVLPQGRAIVGHGVLHGTPKNNQLGTDKPLEAAPNRLCG